MSSFYTRTGDDGNTGLLGKGRLPKFDLRMETLGAIDEATAILGIARSLTKDHDNKELLLHVQRDLYGLMSEVAASKEEANRFRVICADSIRWLEEQIDAIAQLTGTPHEFIVPGDCVQAAFLDQARTVVRRAERRLAELLQRGAIENHELLSYLNRLSSLCFVIELREIQLAGIEQPTLAKDS